MSAGDYNMTKGAGWLLLFGCAIMFATGWCAKSIFVDRHLSIPESSDLMQGDTITVQHGDTLYGLAKQYLGDGARWPELAQYNGITNPSRLPVGKALVLPR